jgi:hypothetical protein
MRPCPMPDPVLVTAYMALADTVVAIAEAKQHVDDSRDAYVRSRRLLRATVPVLPYRPDDRVGVALRRGAPTFDGNH